MKIWVVVWLMMLLGACAPHAVHCDGRLKAINAPSGTAASQRPLTEPSP